MDKPIPYKNNLCPVKIISPKTDKSCFFGYYDLKAYDDSDRYHLCNMANFEDRLQTPDDILELGVIDLDNGNFEKIDETKSWNFQQGAMLQWSRCEKDVVFYNVYENGEYMTVKKNIKTGAKSYCPACANISRDGKYGLKVNFMRIFDFRPGYGYCNTKDPYFDIAQPENDGVFLVDIEKGTEKLILTYPDMVKAIGVSGLEGDKFVVNHITFNPKGDRFMLLLRNFPEEGKTWGTALIVSDLEGNMKSYMGLSLYSHYDWMGDYDLFGFCKHDDVNDLFNVNINTEEWTRIANHGLTNRDSHCWFTKDKSMFIGDTYPDKEGYRQIYLYDFKKEEYTKLIDAYSPWHPSKITDIRTDLHNRFNTKETKISYDTVQNGKREIAELDFEAFKR